MKTEKTKMFSNFIKIQNYYFLFFPVKLTTVLRFMKEIIQVQKRGKCMIMNYSKLSFLWNEIQKSKSIL